MTVLPPVSAVLELSSEEASAWRALWLDAFGRDRQGVNTKQALWHVFAYERYPSISGDPAYAAYESHSAPRYIILNDIMPNRRQRLAVSVDERPDLPPCHSFRGWADFYIFPTNLAWTLARTHEETLYGPYFARHRHYETLNQANIEAVAKRRAVGRALDAGWC